MTELTDLEICKRIAEIEGINFINTEYSIVRIKEGGLTINGINYSELNDCAKSTYNAMNKFNPLTDDALCFRLMVKYGVWRWAKVKDKWWTATIRGIDGFAEGKTLNHAICLVIIEAHKD